MQTGCRLWLACLLMGVGLFHSDVLRADTRNVLVLSPFEPEWFNAGGLDSGLRSGLQSHSSPPVRIFNEYLDLLRFSQPDQQRQLAEYLRLKYADRHLDLLVCIASPTLSFVKQFGSPALQETPRIVIVTESEEHLIHQTETPASAATVVFDINFPKTLSFALRLQPKIQRVVIVGGASAYDRFWSEQFRREASKFQNLKIEFWNSYPMPLLLDELKRLPDDTIVLYQTMVRDAAGQSFLENSAVEQICRAANVPVYGFRRSYLGMGIVGGDLADLQITGLAAGEIGAKILKGEVQRGTLIRRAGTNRMEVDWRQMQRWHLPMKALPANTSVQFRTPSTWELYGWKIAAIAFMCGVEALLILGLLVHRSRHNRSEAALQERSLELRDLAGQLITAQEEERQRIARELHDAYCQQIAVLALYISKIERSLPDVPPSVSEQFTELENRIMTLSNELRHLSHELYPALLKHAGLTPALKAYCREFTTLTGIQVSLSTELRSQVTPPPIALCLYRVVQESLNNVAKYARTDHAHVHLCESSREYCLIIKDEGVGFDPAVARQKHGIGLSSMEERVRLLNGKILIQSQPNAGTTVQVSIPASEAGDNSIMSKLPQFSTEQV
ncbi:MAG: hypothetical protein JO150_15690 [Acidobacteriaceae bacterium]|nr:hypothetical protein [Acidobacteriaceae bacterium]